MIKHISIVYLSIFFVFFITIVNAFAFKLPDTGQTLCYDSYGKMIGCAGTGQDGEYDINPMSYTDNGDGTVTDHNTGLMWQKYENALTYNWYKATGTYDATGNPESQTVCGSLNLGGYTDWRLPSKKELITIVDYASDTIPAINSAYFPDAASESYYWVSTPCSFYWEFGWYVSFWDGSTMLYNDLHVPWSVRCVRGASSVNSGPFIDNGTTVTDVRTGLIWQRQDDDIMRKWDEALSYCKGLNLASQTDWRLPNVKELESITDESRFAPAIDPVFAGTKSSFYWSSTNSHLASFANEARTVDFKIGYIDWSDKLKNTAWYVRCVRGGQFGSLGKLSISKTGTGSGTVVSSAAGIDCGVTCSAYYPINSAVALIATPSVGGSIFSGWSNDLDCLDGVVTLNTDKACVATFDLCNSMSVAMTDFAGPFDSISAAYEGASSIDTIRIIASNQVEGDLVFADKNLTLQGGYDCAFTEPPSTYTTITGSLTISTGSLNIGGIRIQ